MNYQQITVSFNHTYETTVHVYRRFHRGAIRLFLHFPFHKEMIGRVKQIHDAKWSRTHNAWHVPDQTGILDDIKAACTGVAWLDYREMNKYVRGNTPKEKTGPETQKTRTQVLKSPELSQDEEKVMSKYRELLEVRKYSPNTRKVYCSMFGSFLTDMDIERLDEFTDEEITSYVLQTVKTRNYATKTQNQLINALKFYYEKVLGREKKKYWLPRPRKESRLPVVLSEAEVMGIIAATKNTKHKVCLTLIYSSGLRSGELINLRKSDVDFERRQLFVRGGKGKKDRYTMLSDALIPFIRQYFEEYKPQYWFVEGTRGRQYSAQSLRHVFNRSCSNAGIEKKVVLHTLRHSFATHLMESGTDTMYLKELLGHSSIAATAIYSHVSHTSLQKIKSPLDQIMRHNSLND